ncbi:ester cyclase [Nocardioides rubriscoriae]|uniref:ester cyclase n=1 Tax=Nocardioides rubriscoriae TaxID=642762 RepID=UPI0011E037C2|nr:ester cyclase [Nocardioides rubriscoriae]
MSTRGTRDVEAVARRLYDEVWNGRDYAVADQLFRSDFRTPAAPALTGGAAKAAVIRGYHVALPDLHVEVDELVATGDRVAARLTLTGTDTGGLRGRPATGRRISTWVTEFLTFGDDARIVEDWVGTDWLGTLVQLGVLPDPWEG